jgi:hypothetical protein
MQTFLQTRPKPHNGKVKPARKKPVRAKRSA